MSRAKLFTIELADGCTPEARVAAEVENIITLSRAGVELTEEQLSFLDSLMVGCGFISERDRECFRAPGDCFRFACDAIGRSL